MLTILWYLTDLLTDQILETALIATVWKQEIKSKKLFEEDKYTSKFNYTNTRSRLFFCLFCQYWIISHLILMFSWFFVFCWIWTSAGLVDLNRFCFSLFWCLKIHFRKSDFKLQVFFKDPFCATFWIGVYWTTSFT